MTIIYNGRILTTAMDMRGEIERLANAMAAAIIQSYPDRAP